MNQLFCSRCSSGGGIRPHFNPTRGEPASGEVRRTSSVGKHKLRSGNSCELDAEAPPKQPGFRFLGKIIQHHLKNGLEVLEVRLSRAISNYTYMILNVRLRSLLQIHMDGSYIQITQFHLAPSILVYPCMILGIPNHG